MMEMKDIGERSGSQEGLKDYGQSHFRGTAFDDTVCEGHRSERAIYIGLHLPSKNDGGRRRRHRHRNKGRSSSHKEDNNRDNEDSMKPPLTPPEERVKFILGTNDDDADVDHQPHDMFCEMSELWSPEGMEEEFEWKETARWVKFEEDVEEGGERWSKPHVATLSLYSLFELRKCLLKGSILLDCDASTLAQVADLILDNMIANKHLEEEQRELVRDALLRRHRHLHEKRRGMEGSHKGSRLPLIRSLADIGKKKSEPSSMASTPSGPAMARNTSSSKLFKSSSSAHMEGMTGNDSASELHEASSTHKMNLHFMRKIPPGAEASNVLVGEVDFLSQPLVGFLRLTKANILGDLTEVPVPTRFIFILLGPKGNSANYHEIGRSIATLMSDEIFHDVAYKAKHRNDLLSGVDEFLSNCTVLPPGEWDPTIRIEPPKSVPSQEARKTQSSAVPNGNTKAEKSAEPEDHTDLSLVRTGRLFGGLIDDVKRRIRYYPSDIKDGIHLQVVASFVFLYFACLTPIITFGGLYAAETGNNLATMESLLTGALSGCSYAIFSGQPLTIIGSTGPVLVFESITYRFCDTYGLYYLSFRFWIGMWTALLLLLIVAFDLSALVRYITRFTEESFAVLISLIFVVEAFKKLFHIASTHPINFDPDMPLDYNCSCIPGPNVTNFTIEDVANVSKADCSKWYGAVLNGTGCDTPIYYDNVFLLSCLLFLGTFCISISLKDFKTSSFLPTVARQLISDFAVMIGIVSMVLIDFFMDLQTPKLLVPHEFTPTRSDRGWIIHPLNGNPWWTVPAAMLPALLATILIFMDQQITAVIVNRRENKLKKGGGYHLDLLVIAILIIICSAMGLPWFVAATVLSINHVMSLKKESECSAPGEQPQFLGVREQRVTGFLIFLVVGLSVFLTPVLSHIPMAVLYGVFLYMGISSLRGNQFINRVCLFFMPPKYQPDYAYLRHVRITRVHIFTAIQVLSLAILWTIKVIKSISIVFPLMVLAMCFVRKAMDCYFTQHELSWLDDCLPESKKREKDDDEMKSKEGDHKVLEGGNVEIPLSDGNVMTVPVEKITYRPDTTVPFTVNISEEMGRTAIWRQIAANNEEDKKKKKKKSKKKNDDSWHPETEKILEDAEEKHRSPTRKREVGKTEEMESLMAPNIVVEPPSSENSPERNIGNIV